MPDLSKKLENEIDGSTALRHVPLVRRGFLWVYVAILLFINTSSNVMTKFRRFYPLET